MLVGDEDLGYLPFDGKFRKFRMEGKWYGHFSGIPTENRAVRFEVVRSFRFVRTKWNVAYHLQISRFLLAAPDLHYTNLPLFWIQSIK